MTFCCDRYIWMTAVHKPGKENVVDIELRTFIEHIEQMLDKEIFNYLIHKFGEPEIDPD